MLTIHDLLEDPHYKEYFLKIPKLPVTRPGTRPWRLYIRLKSHGKWAQKDFETYGAAFKYFKLRLKKGEVLDAAINCRRASFGPPQRYAKVKGKYITGSDGVTRQATKAVDWQPQLDPDSADDVRWCPWCRRPTAFKYFGKHHALSTHTLGAIDPSIKRCAICGASERIANWGAASSAASVNARVRGKK